MALVELPWRAVAGTSIDERIGREGGTVLRPLDADEVHRRG
jgi:hypothetical protein